MSSTQTTGVHVGTDGIKLGQNFKVDTSGNVTANNMTISGTLTVGGATITAAQLRQGAMEGYNWGSGGGGYGGYSSRGAYALSGGGAGFSAKSVTDNLPTQNSGITDIWVGSFHGSGTSYFSAVRAYRFESYATGESFVPMYLTVDGTTHRVLGAY